MSQSLRDLYVPAESWRTMTDLVAPLPRGMDPAFSRALEPFERYTATVSGDIGTAIEKCHNHLIRFLSSAQEIVMEESGEHPGRLGRLQEFPYGQETLSYQVYSYRGADTVSIREDRMADLLTRFDLFLETMLFMDKKVEEGDLGVLKNSFIFIHKPMSQSADLFSAAVDKMPLRRTAVVGDKVDPEYVHCSGQESSDTVKPGCITRVLKPGYAYDEYEIQEGVVVAAGSDTE